MCSGVKPLFGVFELFGIEHIRLFGVFELFGIEHIRLFGKFELFGIEHIRLFGKFELFGIEHIRLIETTCGDVTLYYDADDNTLWVGSERICGIPPKTEWLGFGSGNFVDGPTAKDVLSDANGRWYRYTLAGPLSDVIVIFECDRKLPDELKSLPIWNQAVGI